MAFSHIRDDISINQVSKQEDRFHCWPHMVGLAKAQSNYYYTGIFDAGLLLASSYTLDNEESVWEHSDRIHS